jgi:hypothetical protein
MARRVRLVIVCEDILHETFMRAFLYKRGFTRFELTFRKFTDGEGDAKQHVCATLCRELAAIRKFASPDRGLIFIIDADNLSVDDRRSRIYDACKTCNIQAPQADEAVFGVIPKWEIENWLAYLRGEPVDEKCNTYKKYRDCESKIYPLVDRLADMCEQQQLPGAPPSLVTACEVYARFKGWKRTS